MKVVSVNRHKQGATALRVFDASEIHWSTLHCLHIFEVLSFPGNATDKGCCMLTCAAILCAYKMYCIVLYLHCMQLCLDVPVSLGKAFHIVGIGTVRTYCDW